MLPEGGWGVAVLTNASSALPVDATSHRIADQVVLILAGRPVPEPEGTLARGYLLMAGLMALFTLAEVRKVWKLRGWRDRAGRAPKKAWASAAIDLLIPVVLLVGVPAAQGMPLKALMQAAPDITAWLIIVSAAELSIGLWKVASLNANGQSLRTLRALKHS